MIFVEASEIVPSIWQGSFPTPGGSVRASGFNLLVLCAEEKQEPASSYPGVEVFHAPNYDDGVHVLNRDDLALAIRAARRIQQVVESGGRALSTCRAGLNRSGLVTGIALHLLYGWDGDTIIRRIRRKRPAKGGTRPLSNPEFTAALRKLTQKPSELPPGWRRTPDGIILPV